MDKILVHGGHPLSGSIKVSGSKNSALPILAATLLTKEPCILHRVPDLSDTHYMLQILMHLGAQVERASGTVAVTAETIESIAPYDVVRKMRASVFVLGPLWAVARRRRLNCRARRHCDRPSICTERLKRSSPRCGWKAETSRCRSELEERCQLTGKSPHRSWHRQLYDGAVLAAGITVSTAPRPSRRSWTWRISERGREDQARNPPPLSGVKNCTGWNTTSFPIGSKPSRFSSPARLRQGVTVKRVVRDQ